MQAARKQAVLHAARAIAREMHWQQPSPRYVTPPSRRISRRASFRALPQNEASPSGNRTPVSRVTGGDTYHYTNEDLLRACVAA